jgi:hypothetical protein
MNEAFEELNDRLEAVENQRNHALRDAVILHGQLCAAKRAIVALQTRVNEFEIKETLDKLPGV